jgi:hypothetical protein
MEVIPKGNIGPLADFSLPCCHHPRIFLAQAMAFPGGRPPLASANRAEKRLCHE